MNAEELIATAEAGVNAMFTLARQWQANADRLYNAAQHAGEEGDTEEVKAKVKEEFLSASRTAMNKSDRIYVNAMDAKRALAEAKRIAGP